VFDRDQITLEWWIISDTHFGHDNIIEYCHRPKDHDQRMLDNWRRVVGEDDPILHLGDLYLGWKLDTAIKRLPGQKFLIKGNHDRLRKKRIPGLGFEIIKPFECHGVRFSHKPIPPAQRGDVVNIHGHLHELSVPEMWDRTRYRSACVEQHNYTPVRLKELLSNAERERWTHGSRSDCDYATDREGSEGGKT
jgi:calcineurin-like phosphoesterase family protein